MQQSLNVINFVTPKTIHSQIAFGVSAILDRAKDVVNSGLARGTSEFDHFHLHWHLPGDKVAWTCSHVHGCEWMNGEYPYGINNKLVYLNNPRKESVATILAMLYDSVVDGYHVHFVRYTDNERKETMVVNLGGVSRTFWGGERGGDHFCGFFGRDVDDWFNRRLQHCGFRVPCTYNVET